MEQLAGWQEPAVQALTKEQRRLAAAVGGAVAAAAFGWSIWQRSTDALIIGLVGTAVAFGASRRSALGSGGRTVAVTADAVLIGDAEYRLEDLAGFWIRRDGDLAVVAFEHAKPRLVPVTCLAASEREARGALTPTLRELEPRRS